MRANGPLRDNFPTAESVSEMKVQAVGNNAEYGQVAEITTTSKGGSNQFHGSAFEYMQNAAFDAKPIGSPAKPAKVANTFGGALSGPVWRNRAFFFVAYEGMRFRSATTVQNTVPTAALRRGEIGSPIRDPFNNNQPFANDTIPESRINPASRRVLDLYPLPNFAAATNNFRENRAAPIDSNQFDARADLVLTDRQSLFGRYTWKDIDSVEPTRLLFPSLTRFEQNRNLVVSHNYTVTPTLLNELRFGRTYRKSGISFPFDTEQFARDLGLQGLGNLRPDVLPNINFSGATTGVSQNRARVESSLYQINNNTTWSRGRHTFKFGVDYRRLGTNDVTGFTAGDDYGVYDFRGTFTGNDFADFLLGLPASSRIAVTNVDVEGFASHYRFYAQDSFKVKMGSLLRAFSRSPGFWLVCLLSLGCTLMRETFNTWTPTYFTRAVGLSAAEAASQSALFPLFGGLSVLIAGFSGDRLGRAGRALIILVGLTLSCGGLLALGNCDFGASRGLPVWLVAGVGFTLIGPYSYFAGALSLDFGGKGGSATASGIIDGVGYLGGVLAGASVARLSVAYGWRGAFNMLAGVALVTSFAAALFWLDQRRRGGRGETEGR